ncbi:unnamed protein product [Cuscuta epithymum]|uniref:Peptidase C1A papain C-terminal domain-containing protein n=1 Tax=Cuscuta epithymum TaxID=186058 RepID=A0AAV0EAZ0_9ASTE|nr:unnamed protein product [Cuscuta epithymum]
MNAIGYDYEKVYITLQNSWGKSWGDNGCTRFAIGTDNISGVNGVYKECYIPYLHNQRTRFNKLLNEDYVAIVFGEDSCEQPKIDELSCMFKYEGPAWRCCICAPVS